MELQFINEVKGAPKPVGAYSSAVRVGNLLFVSGQIAIDPHTGRLVKDSIEAETRQVMENLKAIVEGCGSSLDQVVDVTIFLTDIDFFPAVNRVYGEYFSRGRYPARKTVAVSALPMGVRVELSAIALIL